MAHLKKANDLLATIDPEKLPLSQVGVRELRQLERVTGYHQGRSIRPGSPGAGDRVRLSRHGLRGLYGEGDVLPPL